ncbi:alpha-1A adrenergic receptor-like [Scleropages formosus]|uniref:Adrenoceptor alpha 1B n=1 Tax=Scleropages formosus TaxID=113540 RepID=A0A8C9S4Z6_SCLFO|nr:alpha-1B adrenergic receptor [Scleropages formosus]XP_029112967.1 alpha-1B adrenergic receptor [Scleropages formosus]
MSLDTDDAANFWRNGSAELDGVGASSNANGTAAGNRSDHGPVDLARAVPLGMVLGAFIVFAIAGNILVILSVVCNRHLRIPTNYFIINLAIADLLLSTTVLPVSATLEVLDYWVFGRVLCDIWAAVDVLCCTASIMSLCVISIDRYIGVSYPLRYPGIVTERRALLAMLGVWALSVVISIGPLLGWKQPPSPDDTDCRITEEPFYALFSSLGSFYIPLVVILAMYFRVYVVAKRTTKNLEAGVMRERSSSSELTLRIHKGSQMHEDAGGGGGGAGRARAHHQARSSLTVKLLKFSREKKAAKTLGVVVGMFTLCWLPFFIALPVGSFNSSLRAPKPLFSVIFWLGYFNSCLNPIIYPCYSREFKLAFIRILKCQCQRKKRPGWRSYNYRSSHLDSSIHSRKDSVENASACLNGSLRTLSSASPSPSYLSKSPHVELGAFHTWGSCSSTSLPGSPTDSQPGPLRGFLYPAASDRYGVKHLLSAKEPQPTGPLLHYGQNGRRDVEHRQGVGTALEASQGPE